MDPHTPPTGPRVAPQAIEQALARLVGVEAVRVHMHGDEVSEIHIAAGPGSRAKNVARDVRSYLAAALGLDIDHKRISIAVRRGTPEQPAGTGRAAEMPRVLFRSVQLTLEGLAGEAQVRLDAGSRRLAGSSAGIAAGQGSDRLVVEATLAALQPLLAADVRLTAGGLAVAPVGDGEALVVEIIVARGRAWERCAGACRLEGDRLRAAACATLSALNRRLAVCVSPPWTEFQVEALAEQAHETGFGMKGQDALDEGGGV